MKDLQIKKLYYSISEVSKMLGLEQYVLRYWETEFEQLRPQKNRAGNRIYTEKDIELIRLIKKLTRDDRYTIAGARQALGTATVGAVNGEAAEKQDGEEDSSKRAQTLNPIQSDDSTETLLAVRTTLVGLLQKLESK